MSAARVIGLSFTPSGLKIATGHLYPLARVGEHNSTELQIDVSAILAVHPAAVFDLRLTIGGSLYLPLANAVPVAGIVSWLVDGDYTGVAGEVKVEVWAKNGDVRVASGYVKRSIEPSSDGETGAAPSQTPTWAAELPGIAADVKADALAVSGHTATVTTLAGQVAADKQATATARGEAVDAKVAALAAQGEAEDAAEAAANNLLNGVSTHNQSDAAHADIRQGIMTAESIARGRATAYVFDTLEQLMDWMAGDYERPDGATTTNLIAGDNLYIRDTGVKDYWWDGETAQELEAEAPDLTDYYTKTQVDGMLPILITRTAYDALVAAGTVQAGRTYDIIEG